MSKFNILISFIILFSINQNSKKSFDRRPANFKNNSCFYLLNQILDDDVNVSPLEGRKGVFDIDKEYRNLVVKSVLDTDSRDLVVASMLNDLRRKSDKLYDRLPELTDENIDEVSQVFDILTVGAGVQATIFQQAIRQSNPNIKTIAIEQSDTIASNFSISPDFFKINSTNRATDFGKDALPGQGNINQFPGGSVQLPDISYQKYPRAGGIANTALFNFYESNSDILFKTKVLQVEDSLDKGLNWPARYRVLIKRGDKKHYLYANNIVDASGLGSEKYGGIKDRLSLELIEDERLKGLEVTPETKQYPGIMTFDDRRRISTKLNEPFAPLKGKRIMYIGGGDSGKVGIEFDLRDGPIDGYKNDSAQKGNIKEIIWAGVKEEDCKSFIVNTRTRYCASIAAAIKSKTLRQVDSKVKKIEKLSDAKGFRVTYDNEKIDVVDHVIFTTGYEKRYGERYTEILGESYPRALKESPSTTEIGNLQKYGLTEDIDARVIVSEKEQNVVVAGRLKSQEDELTKQNIFFLGPMYNLIRDADRELTAGVSQNVVSIFINGPRSYTTGRIIGDSLEPLGLKKLSDTQSLRQVSINNEKVLYRFKLSNLEQRVSNTDFNQNYLLANLMGSLSDVDFKDLNLNLKFEMLRTSEDDFLFTSNNIDDEGFSKELLENILIDKKAQSIVNRLIGERKKKNKIIFEISVENGQINIAKSDVDLSTSSSNVDLSSVKEVLALPEEDIVKKYLKEEILEATQRDKRDKYFLEYNFKDSVSSNIITKKNTPSFPSFEFSKREKNLLEADEYLQKGNTKKAIEALQRAISDRDEYYFPYDEGFSREDIIEKILNFGGVKKWLSSITGFNQREISITTREALSGGVKYHFGSLKIGSDIPLKKFDFPEKVSGSLYIDKYDRYDEFKQGAVLSKYVGGDTYISNSPSLSGLTLPETLRDLYLKNLETTVGLRPPVNVRAIRFGKTLKSIEGFVIPENYNNTFIAFYGINSKFAKDLTISKNFKGVIMFEDKYIKYNFIDSFKDAVNPLYWVYRGLSRSLKQLEAEDPSEIFE